MSVIDRVRASLRDPNPIVRKELLATLRTPLYVRSVVVSLIALAVLVVSVALGVSENDDTTEAGRVLFQVFMGGTFLVMAVVGPTLGATAIVQEREARTLDALVLSGLGPRRVVWGKLLAVFAAMAFIPLVSVPMLGAVVLFGGVSIGQIAAATFWVMALGALGVALGVAISARAQSTRMALLGALPASLLAAMMLGGVLSAVGHDFARRHSLTLDGPFFFADAYFALPFGREYLATLALFPLALTGLSFWMCWALAHGGLLEPTQDRALPLKRWALGSALVSMGVLAVCGRLWGLNAEGRRAMAWGFVSLAGFMSLVLSYAFVGEATTPTRRMERERPGVFARTLMPPTVGPSMWFLVALGAASMVLSPTLIAGPTRGLTYFGLWCASSAAAFAAFMGWTATRGPKGASAARLWGSVWLFVTFIGLWLVAALGDQVRHATTHPPLVLVLSPSWAVIAAADRYVGRSLSYGGDVDGAMLTGAIAQAVAAAVFLTLMQRAARRRARGA